MRELNLANYRELHHWSVENRDEFWRRVVVKLGVVFKEAPREMISYNRHSSSVSVERPGWLHGARLNIVDSCFLAPASQTAVVFRDEADPSQLLKRVCIPEAKRILDRNGISYNENDLWFRLYVLHVYHAGALNVDAVTTKIGASNGKDLIQQMWVNTAANFGNNSQNYTQLALAAQLILHEIVYENCDYIFDCSQAH